MEVEGKEEELVVAPTKSPAAADQSSTAIVQSTKEKKGGTLILLRTLSSMARRQPEKVAPVQPEAVTPKPGKKSFWMSFVCGVRPLHHPELDCECEEAALPPAPEDGQGKEDSFHDVRLLPASPPSPTDASSDGRLSSYASAEDLHELFQKTDGDNTEGGDVEGGDEEIDWKAEEFISKFYEQIRLQRLTSVTDNERMIELGV